MDSHSSVNIVNRSISQIQGIAEALVAEDYTETCNVLQKRLQGLYSALLKRVHAGLAVEYSVSNETGKWVEFLRLREDCHGTQHLTVCLEASHVGPRGGDGKTCIPFKRLKGRVQDYLSGPEYAHALSYQAIEDFILECADVLKESHMFELEADCGVLRFVATPYDGCGVLSIVSRSGEAVNAQDILILQDIHASGHRAVFEHQPFTH